MAGIVGPVGLATLRQWSTKQAILDLSEKIEDSQFYNKFGASKESIDVLIDANTVTISRLMEIAPPGTIDPTPFLYDNCLILLAGIQTTALLTNWALTPVDPALHEKEEGENNNNNKED